MNKHKLEIILSAKDISGKAFSAVNSKLTSMRKTVFSLKGVLAGAGLTYGAKEIAGSFLSVGIQADKMKRSLAAATGSTKRAAAAQTFLHERSESLGLVFVDQVKGYTNLAAAAKGTVLEGRATKEIFLGIAEASAALQLSQDETSGALRAITQIMSKGKVQAEELRGQLGERLPGAFQLAAKAMGVSTARLSKMLEMGEVYSDVFLPRFAAQLRKNYAGAIDRSSKSAQANINRFKNAWYDMRKIVMESGVTNEFSKQLADVNKHLTGWLKTNDAIIKQKVPEYLDDIKDALKEVYTVAKDLWNLGNVLWKPVNWAWDLAGEMEKAIKKPMQMSKSFKAYKKHVNPQATMAEFIEYDKKNVVWGKIEPPPPQKPVEKTQPQKTSDYGSFVPILTGTAIEHEAEKPADYYTSFWEGIYEERAELRMSLTEKIKKATLSEYEYEKWALDQEIAAIREKTTLDADLFDQLAEYKKVRLAEINEEYKNSSNYMIDLSVRTSDAIEQNFSDLFFDVMTGEFDNLRDYAEATMESIKRVIADVLGQMAKVAMFRAGASMLTMFAGPAAPAASGAFAGMAPGGFSPIPFAKGGVVTSPVIFPFADGVGLMGEQGPEAIMPLTRNNKGELGVKTGSSQGAAPVEITIMNAVAPDIMDNFLSSARGRNALVNIMSSDAPTFRRVLA